MMLIRLRAWAIEAIRDLRFYILILAAVALVSVVQTHQAEVQTHQAHGSTLKVLDTIVDCTTPGKACYVKSQTETKDVISLLNTETIYAAYCTRTNDTLVGIAQCVQMLIVKNPVVLP